MATKTTQGNQTPTKATKKPPVKKVQTAEELEAKKLARKEAKKLALEKLAIDIKSYNWDKEPEDVSEPVEVDIPEDLVPSAVDLQKTIEAVTKPARAAAVKKVKTASEKTFLPKGTTPPAIIAPAEAVKPTPIPKIETKVDIQTQPNVAQLPPQQLPPKPVENIIFDKTTERWRNKETGKFEVSPTKANNKIISSVSDSAILEGSILKTAATSMYKRKEAAARKESLESQKMTPAETSTNPEKVQVAKAESKQEEASSEEALDQAKTDEKIIELLEKIEHNTKKTDEKKEDKKEEKKGGMFGMLGDALKGMLSLRGLLSPIGSMLKSLLAVGGTLLKGIGSAALKLAGLASTGIQKAAGFVKDKFTTIKDKITGKPSVGAAESVVKKTAPEIAEKAGAKAAMKAGAKTAAKIASKAVPLLGTVAAAGFAYEAAKRGDWFGGALELASGVVSNVPVLGTAAGVALSGVQAAREISQQSDAQPIIDKMQATGQITESEKKKLQLASIEIPSNVVVVKDIVEKMKPAVVLATPPKLKYAPEGVPAPSVLSPMETSKTAQKMAVVESQTTESKSIDANNAVAKTQSSNVIIKSDQGQSTNQASQGGSRIFARNPESTLEKWLTSRYVWQ